jgi:hypothetical protein
LSTRTTTQERDPIDYGLDGSNDGTTWTPITGGKLMGTLYLPTARNGVGVTPVDPLNQQAIEVILRMLLSYKNYRVSITNVYNRHTSALMQIGEIELLGSLCAQSAGLGAAAAADRYSIRRWFANYVSGRSWLSPSDLPVVQGWDEYPGCNQ